ncbi:hypothetical protein DFH09DRAFT_1124370 [Mycena vulgaris]|nr:hypothetical protein DFH09DRAFT_1147232 [Mycena vulgaris]KAJ6603427.1 hypothetical protein DFH09DRAFT_1124370 [Mycena vulgaris]
MWCATGAPPAARAATVPGAGGGKRGPAAFWKTKTWGWKPPPCCSASCATCSTICTIAALRTNGGGAIGPGRAPPAASGTMVALSSASPSPMRTSSPTSWVSSRSSTSVSALPMLRWLLRDPVGETELSRLRSARAELFLPRLAGNSCSGAGDGRSWVVRWGATWLGASWAESERWAFFAGDVSGVC